MMTDMEREFLAQLALGLFSIDEQGRVWRHYEAVGSRAGSPSYMKPVRKRRAEKSRSHDHLKIMFTTSDYRRMGVYAHRIVWMVTNHAEIPGGLEINHKDGNPSNNEPHNLEVVTRRENTRHAARILHRMGKKAQRGEKNTSAKLRPVQVLEIRRLCAAKALAQSKIASVYGVTQETISNIHRRQTWKHLP